MNAPRPACKAITAADSSVYFLDPSRLVGLVSQKELAAFLPGPRTARDSFVVKAARADAVWYYEAHGKSGGMMVGADGVVAIRGCMAVAERTLATYN